MSLTGPVLLWASAAAAVLAFGALVLCWRHLAGPGALRVLGRGAALLGLNALVLLSVLVAANDRFDFYSDTNDLFGAPVAVTTTAAGAPLRPAAAQAPAAQVARLVDRGTPLPGSGGRIEQLGVDSPASGVHGKALVVLPQGYAEASSASRSYPVIEAFHGYPGTPEQWLGAMDLLPHLDAAVAAHRIAPSIVVIPDLDVPPGRDSECVNGPAGEPQVETWLAQDVPHAVEASYRARSDAPAWATAGLSMGGWCAGVVAMLHPQQYSAALAFGGYFRYTPGAWRAFEPGTAEARRYDLVDLAHQAPPPVQLWAETSRTDPLSYPSTTALEAAAHAPMGVTLVTQVSGGHRTSIWSGQLESALAWLGRTGPGFSVVGGAGTG